LLLLLKLDSYVCQRLQCRLPGETLKSTLADGLCGSALQLPALCSEVDVGKQLGCPTLYQKVSAFRRFRYIADYLRVSKVG